VRSATCSRLAAVAAALLATAPLGPAAGAQATLGDDGAAALSGAIASPAPPAGIRVVVQSPSPGATIRAKETVVEVRGTAIAAGEEGQRFDVVIALDVSGSTRFPSLVDVDGDGVVGENPQEGLYAPGEYGPDVRNTDPDDSIFAAEIAAARALLSSLSPGRTRVGLVTFSGEADPDTWEQVRPDQRNARLEVPLSSDFARVKQGLEEIARRGPEIHGATDFSAGIRLATTELAGLPGAVSPRGPEAQKVILFLTDGRPTFPFGRSDVEDAGDVEAAIQAARLARAAGVRINTYGLGEGAVSKPLAATEVARLTLGSFTPVLEPGAIVAALQAVSFSNVEDVAVVNLTLREDTPDVRLNPDGSFEAFVPVREGPNRLLVNALASDGSVANVELAVNFQTAESEGAMRERELRELRQLNTELLRQVEAERVRRERRRQRVEKELEIRGEKPTP
jgi:hypothetical protein